MFSSKTAFPVLAISLLSLLGRVSSTTVPIDARAAQADDPITCHGVINCPLIPAVCPVGYHLGTETGACCESCIKCNPLTCPRIPVICGTGFKAGVAPNACCTTCIPA
ncbi:hypothetical protein GALMADRAFT_228447 [Galerina marginata CBS 339.88]|uniref:Uncharacterized protein n=1 Tax=Galerina marginata (strain CBS 339.88) TaxID=685588 RepID=A0A067T0C1_GALM3|nr:hypothetical protein GALMADRAFT_228447 [Galerina marginata CBS 339.88]